MLRDLLQELAFVLLAHGITPKNFGDLSRVAFVNAAATHSRLRNGRVNQSRVAAQTGLSRADVKRLLLRKDAQIGIPSRRTPVESVIAGWQTDRRFLDPKGEPKTLHISRRTSSFTHLAKKYAGDVPYRAVLGELERIHAVKLQGEKVQLVKATALHRHQNVAALSAVVPALIDGLRIAGRTSDDPTKSIHRLQIPARSDLDLAFLKKRCSSTAKSMLEGLEHSLGAVSERAGSRKKLENTLSVSILLTERGPAAQSYRNSRPRRKR